LTNIKPLGQGDPDYSIDIVRSAIPGQHGAQTREVWSMDYVIPPAAYPGIYSAAIPLSAVGGWGYVVPESMRHCIYSYEATSPEPTDIVVAGLLVADHEDLSDAVLLFQVMNAGSVKWVSRKGIKLITGKYYALAVNAFSANPSVEIGIIVEGLGEDV
jgi:hypothetical protein